MYNVTLGCVHKTIVAVEKQQVLHIDSLCVHVGTRACECTHAYSLTNLAHNAYAIYCDIICGPSVSNIFFYIIS